MGKKSRIMWTALNENHKIPFCKSIMTIHTLFQVNSYDDPYLIVMHTNMRPEEVRHPRGARS